MVDDTHRLLQGAISELDLWESIIRDSDPKLALELRNGNPPLFSKWIKEDEQIVNNVLTRVYKTTFLINNILREGRIKFIRDGRVNVGKVIIAMPNEYKNILKPSPDPNMGLSELYVGERIHTACKVCRIPEGGLGVSIICPFCHGMEHHKCKEK